MSSKNAAFTQMVKLWQETSLPSKVAIVVTAVVCVGLIVGVGYWSSRPHYIPLASNLSPQQAVDIVGKLETNGIPCKLNLSSTSVSVDANSFSQARLLAGSVVDENMLYEEPTGGGILGPPDSQEQNQRRLETALSHQLGQMTGVEKAWVRLAMPRERAFISQQQPVSASVLVKMSPGTRLNQRLAQAVAMMVSSSVPGLASDEVSVSDTDGVVITGHDSEFGGSVSNQLEFRREVERDLARKAEDLLTQMLGVGRAVVQITAEVDFQRVDTTATIMDPSAKVKVHEKIISSKGRQDMINAAGAAGTDSNLRAAPVAAAQDNMVVETDTSETDYANPTTTTRTLDLPGAIKRISVAAAVQLEDDPTANAAGAGTATTQTITPAELEEVIKDAVGFNASRGDEIKVVITPLAGSKALADGLVPTTSIWDTWMPIIRAASLGIAAIVALFLGIMTIKRIRPITVEAPAEPTMTPQRARQISDMTQLVRQNPELLSRVLAAWVNEAAQQSDSGPTSGAKKAA